MQISCGHLGLEFSLQHPWPAGTGWVPARTVCVAVTSAALGTRAGRWLDRHGFLFAGPG